MRQSFGFWFVNAAGITSEVDTTIRSWLARSRDTLIGQPAAAFVAQPQTLRAALAAGQAFELDVSLLDGRPFEVQASPLGDASAGAAGMVMVWRTLQPAALGTPAPTPATFNTLFDAIADMVSVIGEDGAYHLVNEAWCRVVGLTKVQVQGRHTREIFPGNWLGPGRTTPFRSCLERNEPVHMQDQRAFPDGRKRHIESTYYPFGADATGQRCVVVVSRDVTERHEQMQALSDAARLLHRTLHATGDAIFASDARHPDQPVRFVNAQMLQMWGMEHLNRDTLTPRQILEHSRAMFVDAATELARIQHIIEHNLTVQDRVVLNDGRVLLRRCVAERIAEEVHPVRVWSFRDITLQVHAEAAAREHERQLTALLDAFPGFITAADESLRYVYVNNRLAQALGGVASDFIGRDVAEILGPERFAQVAADIERCRLGEPVVSYRHYEATRFRAALHTEVTHVLGAPDARGKRLYYAFGVDITERQRAQAALEAARLDAERANQAKSRFLSNMSHELRTPLNAVLGFAQLLLADAQAPLSQRQRHQVAEIAHGGRHLLNLINDMLDLGRIEAGKLELACAPLALLPLLDECVTLVRPLAAQRAVQLVLPEPGGTPLNTLVMADATRLKQVLLNLLANAIKYNRVEGLVRLQLQGKPAHLRVEVHDTGSGLTGEQLQRLFVPFERMHAGASAVEGTGIGLALSRQLMLSMQGEIGASSAEGQGSCFWIEVPLVADDAAVLVAPTAAMTSLESPATTVAAHLEATTARARRVLYIEDNPVNVVLMQAMLARLAAIEFSSESMPAAGVARAVAWQPQLVLLDIQLPGMSGYEVLAQLRANPATAHIPVVAVSANAMPDDLVSGAAARFDHYVTKPLELQRLLEVVQLALA